MRIYLIRHSFTDGNLKRRYIGKTDEDLCPEGVRFLKERIKTNGYPQAERVYVSPMKRCIQTAGLVCPGQKLCIAEAFSECDFGIFENKNYKELSGCPEYQAWVDSGGTLPFPGGESREEFKRRTLSGFEESVRECERDGVSSAMYIVHGGTIMCIMEKYAFPKKGYFDYQTGNGEGYELIVVDSGTGDPGVSFGSAAGRSGIFVSSGEDDRKFGHHTGKNYKKLFSEDKDR